MIPRELLKGQFIYSHGNSWVNARVRSVSYDPYLRFAAIFLARHRQLGRISRFPPTRQVWVRACLSMLTRACLKLFTCVITRISICRRTESLQGEMLVCCLTSTISSSCTHLHIGFTQPASLCSASWQGVGALLVLHQCWATSLNHLSSLQISQTWLAALRVFFLMGRYIQCFV